MGKSQKKNIYVYIFDKPNHFAVYLKLTKRCKSAMPLFSRSVVSHSLRPHGVQSSRLLCPWDFPGKNTGVDCPFLLEGIFPTQGSNPHLLSLLHCRRPGFNSWVQFLGLITGSGRSPGEGNDNLLQYSCLENPMDRGAWQATVHGVTMVGHDLVTKPP